MMMKVKVGCCLFLSEGGGVDFGGVQALRHLGFKVERVKLSSIVETIVVVFNLSYPCTIHTYFNH